MHFKTVTRLLWVGTWLLFVTCPTTAAKSPSWRNNLVPSNLIGLRKETDPSTTLSLEQRRTLVGVGEWTQKGNDIDSNSGPSSGYSVDISSNGNRLVVARPFRFRVFDWNGSMWQQKGDEVDASYSSISDSDELAMALSMSGDGSRIAFGVPFASFFPECTDDCDYVEDDIEVGYVIIYGWTGTSWERTWGRRGFNDYDHLGIDVSLSEDGRRLATFRGGTREVEFYEESGGTLSEKGSERNDGISSDSVLDVRDDGGAVAVATAADLRVYSWYSNSISELSRRDDATGSKSVGVGETHVAVGRDEDIRVFTVGSLLLPAGDPIDFNGRYMSMTNNGEYIVALNPGNARVYQRDGSAWEQLGNDVPTGASSGEFGTAISSSGEEVAIVSSENRKARVFQFDDTDTTTPFPANFKQVICAYGMCLGNLIPMYAPRLHVENVRKAKWKTKQAKNLIENGGWVVGSLVRLKHAMKFIELYRSTGPGFANNIGRQGCTCAVRLVDGFINRFQGQGILSNSILNNARSRLVAARRKKEAKEWKLCVAKCQGAVWTMTNALDEKQVPLCAS